MKLTFFYIFIVLLLGIKTVSAQKIKISSDFDRGSIGLLKQVSENKFSGQTMHCIKNDLNGNQYYWFYFNVEGAKNKAITFELNNMQGTYRGNYSAAFTDTVQPVISYDNKHWERISDVKYDRTKKTFSFNVDFKKNKAWIAYAHPYPYQMALKFMEKMEKSEFVKMIDQGVSSGGRPIKIFRITNPESTNDDKKNVLITALQHPGEDAGGYFAEGIINFLISDDPEAVKIRDKFIFYVVPVMNPDGLYHGYSRYNVNMEDLNAEWDDDISDTLNLPVEPEVQFVKNWVAGFYQSGQKLDLFMDIHNHSQYWTGHGLIARQESLREFTRIVSKYFTMSYDLDKGEYGGSASDFFINQLNVLSGTVELTQSFDSENGYLDINNYRAYGADYVKAISEFLNP